MGFWFFMFAMLLLLPILMIAFGVIFQKHPPKTINSIYGYRTKMSQLNLETWNYAHQYFGKQWKQLGRVLLFLTIPAMLPLYGQDANVVGIFGAAFETLQCVALILPIIWTEKELHKQFDLDGHKKQKLE